MLLVDLDLNIELLGVQLVPLPPVPLPLLLVPQSKQQSETKSPLDRKMETQQQISYIR